MVGLLSEILISEPKETVLYTHALFWIWCELGECYPVSSARRSVFGRRQPEQFQGGTAVNVVYTPQRAG